MGATRGRCSREEGYFELCDPVVCLYFANFLLSLDQHALRIRKSAFESPKSMIGQAGDGAILQWRPDGTSASVSDQSGGISQRHQIGAWAEEVALRWSVTATT